MKLRLKNFAYFLLLVCITIRNDLHATIHIPAKAYLIVNQTGRFKFEIESIKSNNHFLILVTSANGVCALKESNAKSFDKIITTDNFSKNGLLSICHNIVKTYNLKNIQQIQVLTHDEYSILEASKLRDIFVRSPGSSVIRKFTDKIIMKELLQDKVKIPKYILFDPKLYISNEEEYLERISNYLDFPMFAKPINGTASQGVSKINNIEELSFWAYRHQNYNNYELDEFINGIEYHCDMLIINGIQKFICVGKYSYRPASFQQGSPIGSIILPSNHPTKKKIENFSQKVLKAFGELPEGMLHLEVFQQSNGEIVFIEISARTGGGFIPQCYEKYFGANIQEMHYKAQMGLPVPSFKIKQHAAWCWFPIKLGEIKNINTPVIKSKFQLKWLYNNGDKLDASILNDSNTHPRVGEIIIWDKDFATVERDFDFLSYSFIPYQVTQLE